MADITVEKQGRRVWITLPYGSPAKDKVKELGAHWDAESKRWWVSSSKAGEVEAIAAAERERRAEVIARVAEVKSSGVAVKIPYEAAEIREAAKKAGAVWDRDDKVWMVPADSLDHIQGLLDARKAAAAEKRSTPREPARTAAQVLAASGRVAVSEDRVTLGGKLLGYGRMRRVQAEAVAPAVGDVVRYGGGKRGLVVDVSVWFLSSDALADLGEDYDDPHWRWQATAIEVEATTEEVAADAEKRRRVDAESAAERVWREVETAARDWPDDDTATHGMLRIERSQAMSVPAVVAIEGDRVYYRHPGYYDDWRAIGRAVVDADLAARVRAVIAAGFVPAGYAVVEP